MILQQLLDNNEAYLYADYRSGSFRDISGNQTPTNDGCILKNKKAMFDFNTTCAYGVIPVGTNDFSIIVKQKPYQYNALAIHSNTGATYTTFNVTNYSSGGLSLYFDATYYNITGTKADIGKDNIMGWTCNRDGNARFFYNGLFVGLRDISAKSAIDLQINCEINYKTSTRRSDYDYVLIVKRVLTDAEMAQLTAELENKKWTSKTKSKTKLNNFIKNGLFNNSNFWTLETDETSGNKWTIENSLLKHTAYASTGTLVIASGLTKNIEEGKQYKLSFTLDAQVSGRFGIFESIGGATIKDYTTIYLDGGRKTYSYTWTATAMADTIRILASQVSNSFEISNLKIEEVGKEAIIYKTEDGIRADQKSSTANNKLSNSDFIASDTTFKVSDDYTKNELKDNIVVDGDMEASGTSAWSSGSDAILSKETSSVSGSTQCLRVTKNVTNYPYAYQNCLEVGKTYKLTGYCRGDGSGSVPKIYDNVTQIFSGTNSSSWQEIDVVFIAGSTEVKFRNPMVSGTYVEFDEISIQEIIKDVKVIEYTHVSSGDYVYLPTNVLNQTPNESAYGEWKFWFKKSASNSTLRAGLISSEAVVPNTGTNNGYYVYVGASSLLTLIKVTAGTPTTLITGTPITDTEYHEIKLTRTSVGVFELFVDNISQGTATDTSFTTSNYMVFNPEGSNSKIILSSERGTYGIIKK